MSEDTSAPQTLAEIADQMEHRIEHADCIDDHFVGDRLMAAAFQLVAGNHPDGQRILAAFAELRQYHG